MINSSRKLSAVLLIALLMVPGSGLAQAKPLEVRILIRRGEDIRRVARRAILWWSRRPDLTTGAGLIEPATLIRKACM
jgi:hypothetical protein